MNSSNCFSATHFAFADNAPNPHGESRSVSGSGEIRARRRLQRLDAEISLLDAKISSSTGIMRKRELTQRGNALKDRRNELSREFRKAHYDALVAEIGVVWKQLVH